ncbi:MAG TPA: TetR family transcriptional regulator [Solirubrobacterales bacterium]|nr:TetR family transcriptional regulator [Solirubrobacterales bacterium]
MPARGRRPHDAAASRGALLAAAQDVFRELGYERATTREIGERAGVDPALIARYFGSKENLFIASIAKVDPAASELELEPRRFVSFLLEYWDERGHNPLSRALASPVLSEDVRREIGAIVSDLLLVPEAAELRGRGGPEPELRAELLVALAVGVAMTRANGTLERLSGASRAQLVELLSPAVDALGSG